MIFGQHSKMTNTNDIISVATRNAAWNAKEYVTSNALWVGVSKSTTTDTTRETLYKEVETL